MLPKPERLVTVCHYCNQTFAAEEAHYDFSVTNYVNLVAEAMGIRREDKFKKYILWGSPERILKDADEHISESSFESERIIEVLRAVFMHPPFESLHYNKNPLILLIITSFILTILKIINKQDLTSCVA